MGEPRSTTYISCTCQQCGLVFSRTLGDYNSNLRRGTKVSFCSRSCNASFYSTRRDKATEEEFLSLIDKTPGHGPDGTCWKWTGGINAYGYGVTSYKRDSRTVGRKGPQRAHRIAYEVLVGEIPENAVLLHSCDWRLCCSIHHLTPGTLDDNNQDTKRKNRHAKGSVLSPGLTDEIVREIKLKYHQGSRTPDLAKEYGLNPSTLYGIRDNISWKHIKIYVEDPPIPVRPRSYERLERQVPENKRQIIIDSLRRGYSTLCYM